MLITLLSAGAAFWSFAHADHAKVAALADERDADVVHRCLSEISQGNGGAGIVVGRLDSAELSRRLNNAAIIAGVKDNLVDIDPGIAARVGNSEYNELPVILRFEKISIRQLTVFFQQLALNDPGSRATMIELAPPEASPSMAPRSIAPARGDGGELWTADIRIAYLLYSPKETKPR